MQEPADTELLRQYAEQDSESAFAVLVTRHVNLVYSAAIRKTGNPHAAEEITQAVFIILAKKARDLRRETVLSGWLYQAARLTAANFLRNEIRRVRREQESYMQSLSNEAEAWPQIEPFLDDAMGRLNEKERNAIVLRFFEGKSFQEIGAAFGGTENAAKKRVVHGLEKLRKYFAKHGVSSTAAIIAGTISANSVQAAPVALAKTVTAVAIAKGAAASGSTLTLIKGALKIMAWTKAKTAIVAVATFISVAGVGSGLFIYHTTHPAMKGAVAELQAALHIERPATGTWAYPSEKVETAILHFGSNRADAFPILKIAASNSNPEVRKQAVSIMGIVGMPARPQFGLLGEPSPEIVPLLWQILNSDDGELSSFALTSLEGIGFQPKDIPVLAALLVRSHGNELSQKAMASPSVAQMQKFLSRANNDQMLQRYIPEAIATTIQQNPEVVAPFVSSVEDLLDDANADVRFGAACALAKYKGVNNPKISDELVVGLKSRHDTSRPYPDTEGLKQLMTIETLQRIGPDAKSMIPALLEFGKSKSIDDKLLRELAFRAAGHIDSNLRNTIPEVDQALKNDPDLKNANPPQ